MRSRWFGFVVAAVTAALSVGAYGRLPPSMATHWSVNGTPDGYSSRLWAVSLIPVGLVILTLLFNFLPKVDPRRENYAKFFSSYWLIANAVIVFGFVAHAMILASGLGFDIKIDRLMPVGVGLLLVFLGNYLTRVEPNWFIGIRTPWTLSSDTVWRRTHRTGGWLMVIGGGLLVAAAFAPRPVSFVLFVATIIVIAVVPIVQSYVLWKREKGQSTQ